MAFYQRDANVQTDETGHLTMPSPELDGDALADSLERELESEGSSPAATGETRVEPKRIGKLPADAGVKRKRGKGLRFTARKKKK